MKAFNGKEFEGTKSPDLKAHTVILEDDSSYYGNQNKAEIWCGLNEEDTKQIIDFITKAPILGIDNEVVNKAHELRDLLKKQLEDKEVNKVIEY